MITFSGICTFECSETVDMMSYIRVKPGWLAVIMNRGDWNENIEGTFTEIAQVIK